MAVAQATARGADAGLVFGSSQKLPAQIWSSGFSVAELPSVRWSSDLDLRVLGIGGKVILRRDPGEDRAAGKSEG